MNAIEFFSVISPFVRLITLMSVFGVFISIAGVATNTKYRRVLLYFSMLLLGALGLNIIETSVLKKHLSVICSKSELLVSVSIDDIRINDSSDFICQLANFKESKRRSGSKPTTVKVVRISYDDNTLRFLFKKDSRDKNYYWVYYPGYLFKASIGFLSINLDSWPRESE